MSKQANPRYRGEVVYIFAYDVAYEMTRQPVRELLGQPVAQFAVDASKVSASNEITINFRRDPLATDLT